MHHIFATDGYVNNKRNNYAFGEVQSASWTSRNGSKLGSCKTPGFSGTVFEPIDAYKGDFARAIMYMSVRYYNEDSSWGSSDMTTKSEIKSWAIPLLLRWNEMDPVSQKEIDRNNAIYNDYQHNRNPFVDHPEYARMIWDPNWSVVENQTVPYVNLYPNPTSGVVTIKALGMRHVTVYSLLGQRVYEDEVGEDEVVLDLSSLDKGVYLVRVSTDAGTITKRVSFL